MNRQRRIGNDDSGKSTFILNLFSKRRSKWSAFKASFRIDQFHNSSALLFLGHLWVEKSVSPSTATNPIRWSSTSRETTFMMPRNSSDSLSTGVKRSLKVVLRSHWRGIGHCPKVTPWDATSVPQRDLFNTGYELQLHRNGVLLARSAGASSRKSLTINTEGHGKQTGENVDGISVPIR